MNITRKERLKLCTLSEESFGSKYAWLSYLRTPEYVKELDAINDRFVSVAKWRTLEEVVGLMGATMEQVFEPEIL